MAFSDDDKHDKVRLKWKEKAELAKKTEVTSAECIKRDRPRLTPFFLKIFDAIFDSMYFEENTGGDFRAGSVVCGDMLHLSFRLSEDCQTYIRYNTMDKQHKSEIMLGDWAEIAEMWEETLSTISKDIKVKVYYEHIYARWSPMFYQMEITRLTSDQ